MKKQDMNRDWIATARTLNQALPYLQRYADATVVIKLGGHAMGSDEAMDEFARDVVLMRQVGVNPVVVHGGGPMINAMLDKLDIKSEFVNGKRVTDAATMDVVEMVLSGLVNKRIVQAINAQGGRAIGLSGKDAGLITCTPTHPDLGFVGTPDTVNPRVLRDLGEREYIPVIAPLGVGVDGKTYNINGDTAAGAIAAALKADRLLLLTDVSGVKDDTGEVVTELTAIPDPRDDQSRHHRRRHDPENGNRAGCAERGRARRRYSGRARTQCLPAGTVHRTWRGQHHSRRLGAGQRECVARPLACAPPVVRFAAWNTKPPYVWAYFWGCSPCSPRSRRWPRGATADSRAAPAG